MRNIEKNKKISMLLSLIAILSYSNYTFASIGAVIENTNPTNTGSGQWPTPRFKFAKKANKSICFGAAVYDKLTGLMWAKDGKASGEKNWVDAKSYANNLSLCGYKDWRLPTINELTSLINYSNSTTPEDWLDDNGFNNIQDSYWSSTSYPLSGGYAWYVDMRFGIQSTARQTTSVYVLPVRGPN